MASSAQSEAARLLPAFLYGTAWKEDRTQELVLQALNSGFTGIDTANQRRHYFEEAVGFGIQYFLNNSTKQREDLFIQTKFTFATGQDHRKPYNERDTYSNQVIQSFESSLSHLQTEYLDSYVLHGPLYTVGLCDADWEAWTAMETLIPEKKVRFLGISNVNFDQLLTLYNEATIKPAFVQNRCFAVTQWDKEIRDFCTSHGIIYQGFSLLTANQHYLFNPLIRTIAIKYQKTIPQVIFRFAQDMQMLPLTGTTSQQHMNEDLQGTHFQLTKEERLLIESISSL